MSLRKSTVALFLVAAAAVVAFGATGCSSGGPAAMANSGSPVTETTTAVDVQEPVVISADMSASLKYIYYTTDELIESDRVETIVKGRVLSTKDVFLPTDHLALRALRVQIEESYKGQPAAQITVYEDGGVITLKDALADVEGHFDPSTLSNEEIANTVVDYRFEGASHSEVGDQVILFLRANPNPSQRDSYQIVMSVYGRFTLDETTGEYVRPDMSHGAAGPETGEAAVGAESGESGPDFQTRVASTVLEEKLTRRAR